MSDRKYDPTDPLDVAQRLAYNKALAEAAKLIGNDAYAISFQTMGQYRTALIAAIEKLKEK